MATYDETVWFANGRIIPDEYFLPVEPEAGLTPDTEVMRLLILLGEEPEDPLRKYDPDQPRAPKGSSKGGQWVATGGGVAASFVSPAKKDITYEDAERRLASQQQVLLLDYSDRIDDALGLDGDQRSVIGAWADGAENSTISLYGPDTTYEQVKTTASIAGLLERQKSVIAFKSREGGEARLSSIDLGGDMASHHAALLASGIEFHTLEATDTGTRVWVFQDQSSDDLNAKISSYATANSGKLKTWAGDGEFIGSWSSRDEGAEAYRKQINTYVERYPEARPKVENVMIEWRRRAGQ